MDKRLFGSVGRKTGLVLLVLFAGAIFSVGLVRHADRELRKEVLGRANLVAGAVDLEHVKSLTGTTADLQSPDYLHLKKQFAAIRSARQKCRFVYLMGRRADGTVFFFLDAQDDSREDSPPSQPGDVYDDSTPELIASFSNGIPFVEGPVSDEWGTVISALVPLVDPKTGQCIAVFGMDFDARDWIWDVADHAVIPVGLVLLLTIAVAAGLVVRFDSVSSAPKPVLKRLLPVLAVLLTLIFAVSGTMLFHLYRGVMDERTERIPEDVLNDLQVGLMEQTHGLAAAAHTIAMDDRMCRALRAADRNRLLADWDPLFENLKRESGFTHFYFADTNRICLLRLHQPEKFGDRLDRFTLCEAQRTGKPVSGIDIGPGGGLILRLAMPVFSDSKLQGYVGIGRDIRETLQGIQQRNPGVELAIVVRKDLVDRTVWDQSLYPPGKKDEWDRLPGSVILYASRGRLPDAFAAILGASPPHRSEGTAGRDVAEGGKIWRVKKSSLKDVIGSEVGDILVMADITALKAGFTRDMFLTSVAAVLLLVLLLGLVFALLHRTDVAVLAQQAVLRESERMLSHAEELAQTGSWKLDMRANRCTWSEGCYRIFGCRPEEFGGTYRDFLGFVHPDDRAAVEAAYSDLLCSGKRDHTIEHRIVRRDSGEIRYVVAHYVVECNDAGTVVQSAGMIQDITQRRLAEQTIRHSEEKFRSLFDSMTEMVVLHELVFDEHGKPVDYRILDCNPAFTAITGFKAEAVIGRLATDVYKTETAPYLDEYAHVALTGQFKTFSTYFQPMDKSFEIRVFSPKKNLFATVTNDITERKRIEGYKEMLHEVLQMLNAPGDLHECIQGILSIVKKRTGVDAVGLRLQDGEDFPYFAQDGFSPDFLRTENTLLHRNADGTVCLECTCGLVLSGKADVSSPLFTQGGSFWSNNTFPLLDLPSDQDPRMCPRNICMYEGYASMALIPIRTPDRIVGLIHFADKRKDRFSLEMIELLEGVSAHIGSALMRKWSEKAHQESEARFKALHDASFGGIAIHDKGLILDCNRGLSEISGYSLKELIGMDGLLLISEQTRGTVRSNIAAGSEKPYEATGVRKNGEEYPVRLEARNIPYKGKMVRAVEFRDITEQKRAEADQKRLEAQLIVSQKMESVGRLAGGVAHDFNNMLQAILGYTELAIGQVPPGGQVHDDLEAIKKAAQHSARLTQQLLAFARRQVVAPKVIDLNDTIAAMLKILRPLLGEDIDLVWRPGTDVWPVKMDPVQVDQVLANLCVNARDAIVGVGRITLETSTASFDDAGCTLRVGFVPGDYVLLAVSDTGCGMDAEVRSHIFEPFFSTKEFGKGTGLGLATVYGAVQQNRGFVNVYSEPGQGSTFKIYLPRHVAQATSATAEEIEHPPVEAMRGSETILLVEDELVILNATRKMLERMGYAVLAAETPEEALRLAAENAGRIHLVMTDVVIPRMNGRDLVNALVSLYPGLKCLFMSGYTADVIAHQGVLDDGVHFLQKPFSSGQLGVMLRRVLEG